MQIFDPLKFEEFEASLLMLREDYQGLCLPCFSPLVQFSEDSLFSEWSEEFCFFYEPSF